ncbi:MAG: hypothetical protein MUC40_10670 [Akkermansiaceae bacterium]|nr:hypothetical protein [Akkermansiaceae bacterium]
MPQASQPWIAHQRTGEHDFRSAFRALEQTRRAAGLLAAFFHQLARAVAAGVEILGLAVPQ